jgi:hypothetical protein
MARIESHAAKPGTTAHHEGRKGSKLTKNQSSKNFVFFVVLRVFVKNRGTWQVLRATQAR